MRQRKKDVKARYSTFLVDKEKLAKFLNNRQEEIDKEMERKSQTRTTARRGAPFNCVAFATRRARTTYVAGKN